MKAMISQPMAGKTTEQIRDERTALVSRFESDGIHVVDTVYDDFVANPQPLHYLAKAINAMASVDIVAFLPGWEDARGCFIEHECAKRYGKEIIYA
ncbi:MAG: DUF4406 domain-containing protein [Clostridiales Family XIII bacterium]|jgi:LPS sulfotransferase NodH|nr:DUF4406 domain-containing protein [Clostridiales Family XIII bacterium]